MKAIIAGGRSTRLTAADRACLDALRPAITEEGTVTMENTWGRWLRFEGSWLLHGHNTLIYHVVQPFDTRTWFQAGCADAEDNFVNGPRCQSAEEARDACLYHQEHGVWTSTDNPTPAQRIIVVGHADTSAERLREAIAMGALVGGIPACMPEPEVPVADYSCKDPMEGSNRAERRGTDHRPRYSRGRMQV